MSAPPPALPAWSAYVSTTVVYETGLTDSGLAIVRSHVFPSSLIAKVNSVIAEDEECAVFADVPADLDDGASRLHGVPSAEVMAAIGGHDHELAWVPYDKLSSAADHLGAAFESDCPEFPPEVVEAFFKRGEGEDKDEGEGGEEEAFELAFTYLQVGSERPGHPPLVVAAVGSWGVFADEAMDVELEVWVPLALSASQQEILHGVAARCLQAAASARYPNALTEYIRKARRAHARD